MAFTCCLLPLWLPSVPLSLWLDGVAWGGCLREAESGASWMQVWAGARMWEAVSCVCPQQVPPLVSGRARIRTWVSSAPFSPHHTPLACTHLAIQQQHPGLMIPPQPLASSSLYFPPHHLALTCLHRLGARGAPPAHRLQGCGRHAVPSPCPCLDSSLTNCPCLLTSVLLPGSLLLPC